MLALLASYNQGRLKAKQHSTQARLLRTEARATRNTAGSQAHAIERAAQQNQLLAAHNLLTAQHNKHQALSTVETQLGYSGFDTTQGSANQAYSNAQQQLDAELANLELAASLNMANAWQQALDTRRQGEINARSLEAQADLQSMAAKYTRRANNISLAVGIANAALGAYQGYSQAASHNALQQQQYNTLTSAANTALEQNLISQDQYNAALYRAGAQLEQNAINPIAATYNTASQAAYSGYHFASSFNPFTAALSADANNRKNNWGGFLSVIHGNIPYKIPAAGSIFAQY